MKHFPHILLIVVTLVFFQSIPAITVAEDTATLARQLRKEKNEAASKKKQLTKLGRKATQLKRTLSHEEERISKLSHEIVLLEKKYLSLKTKSNSLTAQHKKLSTKKNAVKKEVVTLVKELWTLHINNRTLSAHAPEDWDALDRRYTWASTLYTALEEKQRALMEQEAKLKLLSNKQAGVTADAKKQLNQVNRKKDELLQKKLRHRKQLQKVSKQQANAESSLRSILSIIGKLNYKIEEQSKAGANIAHLKGVLPWPAHGVIAQRFAPKAKPPVRGIGLALQQGSVIKAVSNGKVVHNDVLRGFGRVVILMHGEAYYTLYAFLADSNLNVGDTVKQKEEIGKAGFYPAVEGTGVYFELRFHQKPINPEGWLSALD